jgi:hypothetical protein
MGSGSSVPEQTEADVEPDKGVTGGQVLDEPSSSFLGGLGKKLGDLLPFGKTSSTDNNKEYTDEEGSAPQPLVGGRRICSRRKNKRLTRRSSLRSKSKKRRSLRNK